MRSPITEEEKEGIKMVKFLQKMADIAESDVEALRGWRSMSSSEKQTTREVYALMHETKAARA
jgi:hypothetical protein